SPFRGSPSSDHDQPGIADHLPPGILITIIPESRSPSARNPDHHRPESPKSGSTHITGTRTHQITSKALPFCRPLDSWNSINADIRMALRNPTTAKVRINFFSRSIQGFAPRETQQVRAFAQLSMSSRPNFLHRLHRHDPRNTFHDLFILLGLLQTGSCLQPHPYFR